MQDEKNWPVVILCGGKGTRMWPLTEEVPKSLIKIGDKAILWHIMKRYASCGHSNFILCLGHMKEKIIDYFSNLENRELGWTINFVDTGLDAMKSERVAKVREYVKTDNFFLTFSDDLSSVQIPDLVNFHLDKQKLVTLTSVPLYSQFGVLELNEHEVLSFKEKPRLPNYWINGGFYVCSGKLFDYLHLGELEGEVLGHLASQRQISAFRHEGFWKCMNTSKEAIEFNKIVESGEVPWKNW